MRQIESVRRRDRSRPRARRFLVEGHWGRDVTSDVTKCPSPPAPLSSPTVAGPQEAMHSLMRNCVFAQPAQPQHMQRTWTVEQADWLVGEPSLFGRACGFLWVSCSGRAENWDGTRTNPSTWRPAMHSPLPSLEAQPGLLSGGEVRQGQAELQRC